MAPGDAIKEVDPKETGTEYNSHMTADGAPGSHSAAFGLASEDGKGSSKSNGGKQPGDVIAKEGKGTGGDAGSDTPAKPERKTGGMADGSSDNTLPGAGSTQATADQGTGKVNPK